MALFQAKHFGRRKGLAPGTLLEWGEERATLRLIRFGEDGIEENRNLELSELPVVVPPSSYVWIQVNGVHDSQVLSALGTAYDIHTLTLEDIQNTDRRPGFESLGEKLFVTTKRLADEISFSDLRAETISFILTGKTLITFLESSSPGHAGLEARLDQPGTRLRNSGADYLAYRIWDESIDSWLSAVETSEDHVLSLEEDVLFSYRDSLTGDIHSTRKRMAWLRWTFRPYRDLRSWLLKNAGTHFSENAEPFLSDLADHAYRVSDLLDLYRDMTDDLMSIMIAVQSNRMNAVMKVLTIIATIFIPLSFIAGVYGMNFARMPELTWKWGYPAALALMGFTALGMLIYFKVKKWL